MICCSSTEMGSYSPFAVGLCVGARLFITTQGINFLFLCILFNTPDFAYTTSGKPSGSESKSTQSCFLCLPVNNSAQVSKLPYSTQEMQRDISNCNSLASIPYRDLIYQCSPDFVECLQRINGSESTRSCSMVSQNNCKIENDVKICHCTGELCNKRHLNQSSFDSASSETRLESTKVWRKDETDDEDLLDSTYFHIPLDASNHEEMQRDSGSGDHPPGVIRIEITTTKPTLVPNLRPDSRTTMAPATSIASIFRVFSIYGVSLYFIFHVIL